MKPFAWLPLLPVIHLHDGAIHARSGFRHDAIRIDDLAAIEYAYQAVVGFAAVWIFRSRQGRELVVSPHRIGLRRLLAGLEQFLPGFRAATLAEAFAAGDVEDTLLLWTAASTPDPLEFNAHRGHRGQ